MNAIAYLSEWTLVELEAQAERREDEEAFSEERETLRLVMSDAVVRARLHEHERKALDRAFGRFCRGGAR